MADKTQREAVTGHVSSLMPKKQQGYIGDKILAAYQFVNSCLCLGAGSLLAAVSFRLAAEPQILKDWQRQNPGTFVEKMAKPEYAVALGVAITLATLLAIVWIIGTWKGRRWALWLHLLMSVPGVVGSGFLGRPAGAILPVAVSLYCILRLTGNVGASRKSAGGGSTKRAPTRRKRAPTRSRA